MLLLLCGNLIVTATCDSHSIAASDEQPNQHAAGDAFCLVHIEFDAVRETFAATLVESRIEASPIRTKSEAEVPLLESFFDVSSLAEKGTAPQRKVLLGIFVERGEATHLEAAVDVRSAYDSDSLQFHDSLEHKHNGATDDSLSGGMKRRNSTVVAIRVPMVARDGAAIGLHARLNSELHHEVHRNNFHELSYSPSTQLLMGQRGIVVSTLQQVSPARTRSVTFLSSGYTSSLQSQFNSDVQSCVNALKGLDATLDSSPWPRYSALMNFYSVFEPSRDNGASRPQGPNHDCAGMSACGPTALSNNLQCAYGTPHPRELSCSVAAVLSLASFAPVSDIIVVIVNDKDFGGTGYQNVAVISSSSTYMTYLLVHVLNHAVAGLGDEYSYDFAEPNPASVTIPNCAATASSVSVPWAYWIGQGLADSTPSQGCSFDNFYRPTKNSCLMRSSAATSMCSVCKERLVTSLFGGGSGMSIDEPRCPPVAFDIFVEYNASTTLTISHMFVLNQPNVSVRWLMPDGTVIREVPTITVQGNQLNPGPNTITVSVTDDGSAVRPSRRPDSMNITSTFVLRPVTALARITCQSLQCTSSSGVTYNYCGTCTRGNCSTDSLVTPIVYSNPTPRDLSQEQNTVMIVAIVLAAVGFGVLVVSALVALLYAQHRPSRVYDMSKGERTLAVMVWITAVISLALAVLTILFAVVYLPKAAVFGDGVFVGCLVLASVVYFFALCKVVASVFRSPVLSAICGIFLFIIGCGIFGIGVFGIYIYRNNNTPDLVASFATMWLSFVSSRPDLICQIQLAFSCSGFFASCTPIASSYCPSGCAEANRAFTNSCGDVWMSWIADKSLRIGVVCLLCGFFFAVAAVIDCIFCVRSIRAKANASGRRSYRKDARAPVAPITMDEVEQVRVEFLKMDREGKGTLQGEAVIDFLEKVFGDELPASERKDLMEAGPLSCEELLTRYFPHLITSRVDPRVLTSEEAEAASDAVALQRLQYAKLEKFMNASGALSPSALQTIYQDYAKKHFATNGNELLEVVRSAARAHSQTDEARMLSGLSPQEIEGLRGAWTTINTRIHGSLDDDQLDKFFQWTHGTILHSHEHFVRWKDMLDVSKTGVIGWGEFCYPFAQRSLLARAREYLFSIDREVPHEMLTKAQVADEFGPQYVEECFLIFEEVIPIERVIEAALRAQSERK